MSKLVAWIVFITLKLGSGQADFTPEELRTIPLSELDPPYRAFKNRDYNRLQPGDPPRPEVLVDLDEGGITVSSIAECALECTKTPDCNAASWYGASTTWTDVRNCWLKLLEPACQLPADAEQHSDDRAFLIARPRECRGEPSIAPPRQPSQEAPSPGAGSSDTPESVDTGDERSADIATSADSAESPESPTQEDTDETINTPAEVQAVLGDRQMNPDVPTVTEIESDAGSLPCHIPSVLLLATALAYIMLR